MGKLPGCHPLTKKTTWSTIWLQASCISKNTHVNRSIRCQSDNLCMISDALTKRPTVGNTTKQMKLCKWSTMSLDQFAWIHIYRWNIYFPSNNVHFNSRCIYMTYKPRDVCARVREFPSNVHLQHVYIHHLQKYLNEELSVSPLHVVETSTQLHQEWR